MENKQNDLELQLMVQRIKNVVEKYFDSDIASLYPDPLNLSGLLELQKIKNLNKIAEELKAFQKY